MTTTEAYLELTCLKDKIDTILTKTENIVTTNIIKSLWVNSPPLGAIQISTKVTDTPLLAAG